MPPKMEAIIQGGSVAEGNGLITLTDQFLRTNFTEVEEKFLLYSSHSSQLYYSRVGEFD